MLMTVCDKQGKILALVDYSKRDKHASEIVSNRQRKIATHPQKMCLQDRFSIYCESHIELY